MAEDLDPGTLSNELRAAVGGAIGGLVIAVVCALLLAFTDLSVLGGIVIGGGFFLIWGTQAVRLIGKRRQGRPWAGGGSTRTRRKGSWFQSPLRKTSVEPAGTVSSSSTSSTPRRRRRPK